MKKNLSKINKFHIWIWAGFALYSLSFKILFPHIPQLMGAVPIALVGYAGYHLGIKPGLLFGILANVLTMYLFNSVGHWMPQPIIIGGALYIFTGIFLGYAHKFKISLIQKNELLNLEIQKKLKVEKELQNAKENLEDAVEERTIKLSATNIYLRKEIRKREAAEKKLDSMFKFERLVSDVATKFANISLIDDVDVLIENTLKELTNFLEFDRGYIFLQSDDKNILNRKFYFHSEGVPEEYSVLSLNVTDFPVWGQYLLKGETFFLSKDSNISKSNFDESPELDKFKQNTVIASPLKINNQIVGFFGFDRLLAREKKFSVPESWNFITSIGNLIQVALSKKSMLEDIRISERRYKYVAEIITDFAFSFALVNGRIEKISWVTESFFSKTGYPKTEKMFTTGWRDIFHPDDANIYQEAVATVLSGKHAIKEIRIITANKQIMWIKLFVVPEMDKDGKVLNAFGGAQDITLQKTFENILQQNEKKFHLIFDSNPMPMLLLSPENFNIIDANFSAAKQYGYSKEDITNLSFANFFFEDDKDVNITELKKEEKDFFTFKAARQLGKNGKVLTTEIYSQYMHIDEKNVILVIPLDITEKTRISNENKLLAHSVRAIQECVSITDINNNLIFVNDSFCKTYGYEFSELIGKNIDIMHGQSVPANYSSDIAKITIKEGYKGEFLNRRKSGVEFPISLSTSHVKDENGNLIGLIGVATDITERKISEKALVEAVNTAQQEKAKTEAVIKGIGEAVRLVDPKFNIIYQNEICEDVFSLNNSKPCYAIFAKNAPCEDCPLFTTGWEGDILHAEKEIQDKKNLRYFDITISPLKDASGKITSIIEMAKEITDRKVIELSLKEKISKLELISGLIYGFKDIFDIKSLIKYIYEEFPTHIPKVDGISILLYNENTDELYGGKNLLIENPEYRKRSTIKINYSNLTGRSFLEAKPIYIKNCSNSSLIDKDYFYSKRILSTAAIPLITKQKKIGVIRFDNKVKSDAFEESDIEFFVVLAEQLALLIENDRLIDTIKNSEKEIRDSENFLSNLIDSLQVGILSIDPDNQTIVDINKYALQMIGYPKEYLIGKLGYDFISPVDINNWDSANLPHNVIAEEYFLLNISNEKIPILKSVIPIFHKGKNFLIESFIDMTNIKKIENELRESEETLQLIFRNLSDVVMFVDEDLRIVNITPSIENISGRDAEDIRNKSLIDTELFSKNSLLNFIDYVNGIINVSVVERKIFDIPHIDGTIKKVEVSGSQCHLEGKEYAIIVMRDITLRFSAEETLKEYNQGLIQLNQKLTSSQKELKELNANKDKFFSIIAHDLRSPFNALLGFSDFLVNDYDTLAPEEIQTFAGHINLSAKQLFELLENLLQWSRIQTGRLEYQPQVLSFEKIVNSVFGLLSANALKKGIILEIIPGSNINIYADKNAINSVFQNLISNAIKFTNKGGKISVAAVKKGKYAEIKIKDTGVGISEENLAKLFKIEVQHSTNGTDNEQGSGLGLILCKELVEKNKGKITVSSKLNEGTTFEFTLPVEEV